MTETSRFVILKEDHGDFVPFGHVAKPLSLAEAKVELASLASQYLDETFHIFGDCGAAIHHDAISIELKVPDLTNPKPQTVVSMKR